MLATLRVKNLALVENIRLDFRAGLNVITGETGAGKSILVGALDLLLGERADKRIIREGEETCGAEAVFQLKNTRTVDTLLADYGVTPCEDNQLIIRRVVKASGSSQNLINDSPVTLNVLKAVGQLLVDMHGPHDHQSLLNPSFQLDVLDAYGHLEEERKACADAFDNLQQLLARRSELEGDDKDVAAQIDLLSYRIKEIRDAGIKESEEEDIQREHLVVSNAQRILELGGMASRALIEGEATAFDTLTAIQRSLDPLARILPEAEAWRKESHAIAIQIKELGASITSAMERIEADPGRLVWLDERIAVYQKLRRKHGGTVADILKVLDESGERLKDLQTRGERLAALDKDIAATRAVLLRHGQALRRKREEIAGRLAKVITRELRELGFAHGAFSVALREVEPCRSGIDAVEFGFAPNVGESSRPLRDIASSGEISRVMLATKAALAGHDRIPVLVFDEIDANIGGEIGNAVGKKLGELGKSHQVICITHLPQVAICGTTHFAISKSVRDGRTVTDATLLERDARVEEVARMLGGRDMTKVTLQHAREMLQKV
ncbi:MAG: DNA repair protein RecN [bacterium]